MLIPIDKTTKRKAGRLLRNIGMIKRIVSIITLIALSLTFALLLTSCEVKPWESKKHGDGYTLYENVSYGNALRHTLDLCVPDGASGEVGLVLFIHGGGWLEGDKSAYRNDMIKWARDNGYVSASINYRFASGDVHADEILSDVSSALEKIKSRTAELSVNTERVMLVGSSSGAHLALLYAYKIGDTAPIKPAAVVSYAGQTNLADGNFFGSNPMVDSIVSMFNNISGFEIDKNNIVAAISALREASPLTYITEKSAPTIICHGDSDKVVPISNAYALDSALAEHGVEHKTIIYANSDHDLKGDDASAKLAEKTMLEYASKYLSAE